MRCSIGIQFITLIFVTDQTQDFTNEFSSICIT